MSEEGPMRARTGVAVLAAGLCITGAAAAAAADAASASPKASPWPGGSSLYPGDLLVSGSTFVPDPGLVAGKTQLPPGCTAANCVTATADGFFPQIFNNVLTDASFGITSPIFLDEITPSGRPVGRINIPSNELVTSFSSKSELALNLSTDGKYVTFMGYATGPGELDVSNANTPGAIDPTNPVPGTYYRAVAELNSSGQLRFTETNAYSGDNGRAAIEADVNGQQYFYTAGNAGNGSNPQPNGIVLGAGAQLIKPSSLPERVQQPGTPTPVGSFDVTQLGDKQDKIGKDDNFRGLTISNNVLYYTKGSGSNGVNTVYFVDTTGTACPNGTGLPVASAQLPTSPLSYSLANLQADGLPSNMCILKGFPTTLAKSATMFPFGIWFANADTLYVADEGNGTDTYANGEYTAAASDTSAGLEKWVYNSGAGKWELAYTLQSGLSLGQPYSVAGLPSGDNAATGLPWEPATDGLRNLTGRVNPNGTVTIWAVTSTVSGGGDQGADPNQLVAVTDQLSATTQPSGEDFTTVIAPHYAQVLRGVSFTPHSW
jgi:hypothetical protein